MNQHTVIGIDLAKRVFQVCIIDIHNQQVHINKALKNMNCSISFVREHIVVFFYQPPVKNFALKIRGFFALTDND